MVLFSLEVKATFENVETLYTTEEFDWFVKVKCSSCGEDSGRGWHSIRLDSECETKRGRVSVNFARKCKFCSREGTLTIVKNSVKQLKSPGNGVNCDYTELARFDCRGGLEPVEFTPMGGWVVETSSGVKFRDVDLTEKEWAGYDERGKQPVGVYDFQSRFVKV